MLFANQTELNWNVVKAPLSYATPQGTDTKIKSRIALLRDDSYEMLSIVSPSYEVFQNHQLKNLVMPMVEEGLLKVVNMGELGGGRRVFIQAQMANEYIVAGEETNAQLTFLNGHDGGTMLSAGVTSVRVICQNTFAQAMTDMGSRLRHSVDIHEKAVTIQETAKYVNEGMIKYQEAAELLAVTKTNSGKVDELIARAFGKKSSAEVRCRDQIQQLFTNGTGNSGQTLWDAFNAVTEYTTHKAKNTEDKRFQYAQFGSGAVISRRAMDAALAMV